MEGKPKEWGFCVPGNLPDQRKRTRLAGNRETTLKRLWKKGESPVAYPLTAGKNNSETLGRRGSLVLSLWGGRSIEEKGV